MVGMGILQNNIRLPSPECYTSSLRMTIYSDTLHGWDIISIFDPLLIWTLLPNLTFYLIVWSFHRTFATGAACQQRTLTPLDTWSCPIWDLQMFFCWDHWHYHTLHHQFVTLSLIWLLSLIWNHRFMTPSLIWLLIEFDITDYRFPWVICNGCGIPTGYTYSSGHLVLSHFGTCMCSNVETSLSWACLVSRLLSFEHPSVLLFCFPMVMHFVLIRQRRWRSKPIVIYFK